jgi:hypothetical protein
LAYIAVNKGSNIGIELLYAQQVTIHELQSKQQGKLPSGKYCLRANAIQRLNIVIQELQQKGHAIILMLDANQASSECYRNALVKNIQLNGYALNVEWTTPLFN